MEDLQNLKYKELQRLAKAAGIKANSPKAELVTALLAFNNECEAENEIEDDSDKKPQEYVQSEPLGETLDVVVQNKMNETFEKENSVLNVTFDKEDELNDSQQTQDQSAEEGSSSRFVEFMNEDKEEVSIRRSSRRSLEKRTSKSTPHSVAKSMTPRDYMSRKNKTPLRQVSKTPGSIKKSDSNIPRFMKYATKTKLGSVRKVPNFAKIHAKNSEKLDSLDDYVEKKKKLTDTVKKQLDQARATAEEHNSIVKRVKSKFVPAVTSTAKMNLNFGNISVSNKPFKFDSKPVAAAPKQAPKQRQDPKAARPKAKAKPEDKKPVRRESKTDPKPLLNITNKSMTMERSMTRTPGRAKFDLKASLAKGLSYQPHKGKVKPLVRKKERSAPVLAVATQEETKARQMEVIRGVRLNKRAELMMMRRKMSS